MIAFPSNSLPERTPSELDLEHSKRDIALVRSLSRKGLLSAESMAAMAQRLESVAKNGDKERIRVAADKALVSLQVALLRLLRETATGPAQTSSVTNQQINFYLPTNGRELANGHNGNGRD